MLFWVEALFQEEPKLTHGRWRIDLGVLTEKSLEGGSGDGCGRTSPDLPILKGAEFGR
jgi:hypothetical protein